MVYPEVDILERMAQAVENVRRRLLRATAALETAGLPYAVAGGHAVAVHVERMDEGGVRVTPDVDIIIRRADWERARDALLAVGFFYFGPSDIATFHDGLQAIRRNTVHLLFAGEKVRNDDITSVPDVTEAEPSEHFRVLTLDALVRSKLTAFRLKDRVHIRDMLDVGVIDASWTARFPPELAARLQAILDDPHG